MTRAQSRRLWKAVANAEFDQEVLLWVANVAAEILKADDEKNDKRRHARIVAAAGLFNKFEHDKQVIREVVERIDFECMLIETGRPDRPGVPGRLPRKLRRGERSKMRRDAVAAALELQDDNASIDKKIATALKN